MKVAVASLAAAVVGVSGLGLSAAAEVSETADRLERRQSGTTLPPPAADLCNSMTYTAYDEMPVAACYRAVTAERGWHQSTIAAWEPFLITNFTGVTQGESSQCWNMRGGDRITSGEPCTDVRRTSSPGSDTGFGQATRVLWGAPDGILCARHGYCSWQSILASPYDSMLSSVVLLVEDLGSDPWCFADWARAYHECWRAPDR
jgi:hypothetical protein